jgi:hypothetical protein
MTLSNAFRPADDFHGTTRMSSYKFCCTAKQETPNTSLPMRAYHDQVGAPFHGSVDDALSHISHLDGGVSLEAGTT